MSTTVAGGAPWLGGLPTPASGLDHRSTPLPPPSHESIFHTLPIKPGVLSPVLLQRNGRLFLGYSSERRGIHVDLKGQLTDVVLHDRTWRHLAVLYDPTSSTLQLYCNGVRAGMPLRVDDDTHRAPFQKVSMLQRKVVFGSGSILQGATGLIDNVLMHTGHGPEEIRKEYEEGLKYVNHIVPDWMDTVSWSRKMLVETMEEERRWKKEKREGGQVVEEEVVEEVVVEEESEDLTLYDIGMAILSAPPMVETRDDTRLVGASSSDDGSDGSGVRGVRGEGGGRRSCC